MGSVRTALDNLLFARRENGVFILRIEDTDVERSKTELSEQILSSMKWMGLDYDEGPFYQSRRYDLYRAAAEKLLAEGKAYRAFETPEELDAERKKAEAEGRAYRYSGAGRDIPPEESERRAHAPASATSCASRCRPRRSSSRTSSGGPSSSRPTPSTTSCSCAPTGTRSTTSASAWTTPR